MIGDEVIVGMHQLDTHRDREGAADYPGADGENQIERADVFVIGGEQPAPDEARVMSAMVGGAVAVDLGGARFPLVSHHNPLDSVGGRRRHRGNTDRAASRLCAGKFLLRVGYPFGERRL